MFGGTKFATSTQLSERILHKFETGDFRGLPDYTTDWLEFQKTMSVLPQRQSLLIETFPRHDRHHLCVSDLQGAMRNKHWVAADQTDGGRGLALLGFVSTDYATLIWGLDPVHDPATLLDPQKLENGFENWLAGNAVMKRSFRAVATIAGLIERNLPGSANQGGRRHFHRTSCMTPC